MRSFLYWGISWLETCRSQDRAFYDIDLTLPTQGLAYLTSIPPLLDRFTATFRTPTASSPPRVNPHPSRPLRICALSEVIPALSIVGDHGAVLGAAVVAADGSDDHAISARAAATVRPAGLDWELQEGSRAAEREALIVFVLVGVGVAADGLSLGVVRQSSGSCIVDVGLAVGGSWGRG
jgi:hypothetical protein